MELGNVEATKRLVAAGLGVSVISAIAVRAELRARTLAARAPAPPLERRLAIVRRRDKRLTPALGPGLAAVHCAASPRWIRSPPDARPPSGALHAQNMFRPSTSPASS